MNNEVELRDYLRPKLERFGVKRAVMYCSKELQKSLDTTELYLMIESGLKGLAFCELIECIYEERKYQNIIVLDIAHFGQWSDIDGKFALKGIDIYEKSVTKKESNLRFTLEIRELVIKVLEYCHDTSYQNFEEAMMLSEACEFNLHKIGQLSDRIDEDYKNDNPQISWSALSGLKNNLTYSIKGTNKQLLWQIIESDFPKLLENLEYVIYANKQDMEKKSV